MRKKIFIEGIAVLCIGMLSIQVCAEEYHEQPAYQQEGEVLEELDEQEEYNSEEKTEAETTIEKVEENEVKELNEDAQKNDVVNQQEIDNEMLVLEEELIPVSAEGPDEDSSVEEEVPEPISEIEKEPVLTSAVIDEKTDEDPQRSTSMNNSEVDFIGERSSGQNSRASRISTYIHNSRYDSGYKIINGIDVSYYNGAINWSAVKSSGIEYAIIRVGYRGYGSSGSLNEDIRFRTNIKGALDAGLKVGVYFFSQAVSEKEAQEEANYVLERISGYNISLPVVIDFEYANDSTGRLTGRLYEANLSRNSATSVCKAFCSTVKAKGYDAMVYANKSMLENNLNADDLSKNCRIWLANYTTKTSYVGDYYAWQYTSGGSVNGINGYVDCNFFYEKENVNIKGAQEYVKRLYRELLGREADSSGLNTHTNAITSGNSTASDTVLSIVSSTEFTNKKYSDQAYVERLYRALLNRNASSSEIANWVSRVETGVSRRYVLIQFTNSAEFIKICRDLQIAKGSIQPIENRDKNYSATAYVSRCYLNILGRKADSSGLNTWTGKLLSGSGGTEIVKDLVVSQEFINNKKTDSEFIDILYKSMLGRNADANGKKFWLDCLETGVSYRYIINGFSSSKEFRNLCSSYGIVAGTANITEARDKNIGVTGFVNRNYKTILNRKSDTAGLNYWCGTILDKKKSPAQVAYGFVFSKESVNKKLGNSEFLEMLYQAFLGRNSDSAGKQYWMNVLNSGRTRENVFWGFANSAEFRSIVASYGL